MQEGSAKHCQRCGGGAIKQPRKEPTLAVAASHQALQAGAQAGEGGRCRGGAGHLGLSEGMAAGGGADQLDIQNHVLHQLLGQHQRPEWVVPVRPGLRSPVRHRWNEGGCAACFRALAQTCTGMTTSSQRRWRHRTDRRTAGATCFARVGHLQMRLSGPEPRTTTAIGMCVRSVCVQCWWGMWPVLCMKKGGGGGAPPLAHGAASEGPAT